MLFPDFVPLTQLLTRSLLATDATVRDAPTNFAIVRANPNTLGACLELSNGTRIRLTNVRSVMLQLPISWHTMYDIAIPYICPKIIKNICM